MARKINLDIFGSKKAENTQETVLEPVLEQKETVRHENNDSSSEYFSIHELENEVDSSENDDYSMFDKSDVLDDIDSELEEEKDAYDREHFFDNMDMDSEDQEIDADSDSEELDDSDIEDLFNKVREEEGSPIGNNDEEEDLDLEGEGLEEDLGLGMDEVFTAEEMGAMYSDFLAVVSAFTAHKWSKGELTVDELEPSSKVKQVASKAMTKIMAKMNTRSVNPAWVLIIASVAIVLQPLVLVYMHKQTKV